MAKTTTKSIWVKMLEELGFKINKPMHLCRDHTAATHIANNPVFHERTKHLKVDCHYMRDKVKERLIDLRHMRTKTDCRHLHKSIAKEST